MNDKTPIFRSLAMIEERIQEKLTVNILAEGIHFSKYHYQRLFREAVGDSVMGYVTRRKLALAAEELAETDNSILEIALKYGYDSHEGFTRSFKKHLGVTPTEYRKYRLSIPKHPNQTQKKRREKNAMLYSKNADSIIRELNSLIVQAGETTAYTRKYVEETTGFYARFWDFIAHRTDQMAEKIKGILERVTVISWCPDEISARFLIIKSIEDAAFEASIIAFQTGLTIARATPEHQEIYGSLCEKYDALAMHARLKAEKIADFFGELASLLFQDMRQNARQKLQKSIEIGRTAADGLSSPDLSYTYIAEGIQEIANELSATALEDITVSILEDSLFRLDTIVFAVEADAFQFPPHKILFNDITNFRRSLADTLEFFRSLPDNTADLFYKPPVNSAESEKGPAHQRTREKIYSDIATQESILLFYLKGELQKLGDSHLTPNQKISLESVCNKLSTAIHLASSAAVSSSSIERSGFMQESTHGGIATHGNKEEIIESPQETRGKIICLLKEVYDEMLIEAERLGIYGGPIRYLAEEIKAPVKYLVEE